LSPSIQRWASALVGAGAIALAGWVALGTVERRVPRSVPHDAGATSSSATPAAVPPADASSPPEIAIADDSGVGASSDGGTSVATLPPGAPRSVRIGVVLVQFVGAEGAPGSARAKPDALKFASTLVDQAKIDWKGAVKAGDSGSSEDIGRIPRGVLERSTELVVFGLEKDGVSDPLETPRGYWVVRRVE
jgi:hypothetical protein